MVSEKLMNQMMIELAIYTGAIKEHKMDDYQITYTGYDWFEVQIVGEEWLVFETYDSAFSYARESLIDDSSRWREAVWDGDTTEGLEDWVDMILDGDIGSELAHHDGYEVELPGGYYAYRRN